MHPAIRIFLASLTTCFGLSAGADTLLVVGAIPVSSGDATTIGWLEQLGHRVTVVGDSASSTASANGMSLVIISESVAPGKINSKFSQVSVPVIAYEPAVYDDLGLTGTVRGTDYGSVSNQTQLRLSGTHPLTAGLTGIVTVGIAASKFSWGKPGAAAIVAATQKNNSTRATIFAYESGALLANGTPAPARRVALHPNVGAIATATAAGQNLFIAAIQWVGNASPPPPPAGTTRILPLGDSITQGSNGHWSYRRNLEAALAEADCSFDMIGGQTGPASGPGSALLDRDHEGHSGFRTIQILNGLPQWLPGNVPDWALIHIGTNDVLKGVTTANARRNISNMLDMLRDANPNVGILLAQVIPNRPENEASVVALNDAIASLAVQMNMPSVSPVIVVDHYSGYSTFTHNYDQIHPNDAGEALMAERWIQALLPQISSSCGL